MTKSPQTDLASFSEGMGFLVRRPLATLGLAALGTLLAALPPFLQMRAGLPDEDVVRLALTFAGMIPLEMYFVPRFLAEADAAAGAAGNPAGEWEKLFDARWLPAMLGRLLLYFAVGTGVLFLILPGFMVLLAFGWVPLRMLLRGEGLAVAARGSLQMMVQSWRRVLLVAFAVAAIYLAYLMILSLALARLGPDPGPMVRLAHPAMWLGNFLGTLLNIWTSAALLALYRRVEAVPAPEPGN